MLVIKLFISNCVGHDFWHGASTHFKQRLASLSAPRSDNVVCFMSEKSFLSGVQDYGSKKICQRRVIKMLELIFL